MKGAENELRRGKFGEVIEELGLPRGSGATPRGRVRTEGGHGAEEVDEAGIRVRSYDGS